MYEILKFSLGRDALKFIVTKYQIKEMKIPYYLCDVVRHTLVEQGCKPIFYHIDDNFYPDCDFEKDDYILYPNYWGICGNNVQKLVQIYPKLIIDNAHAFYDKPRGFACFNAGHKFGFEESFLWLQTKNNSIPVIQQEGDKDVRQKIFFELHKQYGGSNLLDIDKLLNKTSPYPFVYPYLAQTTEKADDLAAYLKKKGKTVYRYWSPLPKSYNEYKFYSRLVPIPVLPLS